MKNLLLLLTTTIGLHLHAQINSGQLNGIKVPQYIGSTQGGSTQLPVIYRAQIFGLDPNAPYKYISRGITADDFNSTTLYAGAGDPIFMDSGSWKITNSPNFSTGSGHDTFYTSAGGDYEGWFGFRVNSDSRFTSGNNVYPYLALISLFSGDTLRFYCIDSMHVLAFGTTTMSNDTGTGIWGKSAGPAKDFVGLMDNSPGANRPIALTMIENDALSLGANAVNYYKNNVEGKNGCWGAILPNYLPTGVRKIERYDRYTGLTTYTNEDSDGTWGPNAKSTVNPSGGLTAISFDEDDAALVEPDIQFWARTSSTSESAGTKEVYVVRKYSNDKNSSVRLTIVGNTAQEGTGNDYLLTAPKTITFTPGAKANDTTILTINDDNASEGDETIVLRLDQPLNCVIGTEVAHTITIKDNDTAFASPDKTLYVVKEDAGKLGIKIKMDKPVGAPSTLRLIVKKQGDSSYIPGEFRLGASTKDTTFTLGKTNGPDSTIIDASIIDDVIGDPHDTFILALRTVSGTSLVKDSLITIVVRDNDGPSVVQFVGTTTTVPEGASSVDVRIRVVNRTDAGADFTLRLLTAATTATQGSDFTYSPSSKIINIDNNTPDTIVVSVPLSDDDDYEPTEKIYFGLGTLSNVRITKPDTFVINLINDDYPIYSIGAVNKQSGANRSLDSAGVKCRIKGTVYGGNLRTSGLQFTLADVSGGISVLSNSATFGYTVTEKDSLLIQGVLSQVQGQAVFTQLDTVIKLNNNRSLLSPVKTGDVNESAESKLMKAFRVKLTNTAQWPASAMAANSQALVSVMHTSGVSDTILLDAEAYAWNTMAAPTGYINVTGIGGQADASSPFTTGHYLTPRNQFDIEEATLPVVKFFKTSDTITELADSFRIDFVVAPLDENYSFDVVVKSATAVQPKDFNFNTRTIQVIKNNSVNPIRVNISDDTEGDGPKDVYFAIRNIVGPGSIGADSVLYLYIKDNEANSVKGFSAAGITMYPNPGTEKFVVQAGNMMDGISVTAADGRIVYHSQNVSTEYSVDASTWAAGVYHIRLTTRDGVVYGDSWIKK